MRSRTEIVAIFKEYDGIIGLAKFAGTLDDGIEDRFDVGRRGGDHLENVAAAGLVGQRLVRSRVLACTSSNSRTFSMAITAWSAKVCTSSICLSVNGSTVVAAEER